MLGSVVALLLVPKETLEVETTVPTTTTIIFPRPVQVLMPNDLCDNMQGALMFYVRTFLDVQHPIRLEWYKRIETLRQDMRDAGCG